MIIISEEQIGEFKSFIDSHSSFLIVGHKEPDGDCVSSCIGMAAIVEHFGKEYQMLSAGPFKRPEIRNKAELFSDTMPFMTQFERDETGLIIVDCSELLRLGDIDGDFKGFDTFIVDHHKTADASWAKSIIDSSAPAACCLVQQLYEKLIGKPTPEVAKTLFFGLSTDTGYFRFLKEDSAEVFRAAARLVDAGANPRKIYDEMTSGKSFSTRKLLGVMLSRVERYYNNKLCVTYETMEDTKKYGLEGRDSDALYSLLLAVDGVEAVLFVRQETEHSCTAGFRSRDSVDVSAIAAKFGGGGHKNAAGLSMEGKIENVIPMILKEFAKVM
ncbi:MAG: bifunctional oligoribonuclease/PAP phosphatase NrnA [Treponema sp.]|nr:bifunctional oligoribonuclease/PAP phosphatase NrnA [Treponema sp.]